MCVLVFAQGLSSQAGVGCGGGGGGAWCEAAVEVWRSRL